MKRFFAVIVGVVFFLSGMMKLVDPVGTSLIMDEYFKFFHIGFMGGCAKALGVALASLEALVGVALITGVWRKVVAIIASAMTVFFTIVTICLAVKNPPMECGCFGEVIHLTHFQTLLKNIVLLVLCALAFLPLSKLGKAKPRKYVTFALGVMAVIGFAVRGVIGIPVADFTEMKPGAEVFGDVPLVSVSDVEGDYCEYMFEDTNTMAVVVNDADAMTTEDWQRASEAIEAVWNIGFTPALFVASTPEDLEAALSGLDYHAAMQLYDRAYFADRRKLLTLNRSNGGLVYLSDGTVIRKWHASHIPDTEGLQEVYDAVPLEQMVEYASAGKLKFRGTLALSLAVLLLI